MAREEEGGGVIEEGRDWSRGKGRIYKVQLRVCLVRIGCQGGSKVIKLHVCVCVYCCMFVSANVVHFSMFVCL